MGKRRGSIPSKPNTAARGNVLGWVDRPESGVFGTRVFGIHEGRQRGLQRFFRSRRHRCDFEFRLLRRLEWEGRRFDDQLGRIEPEGSGRVEDVLCNEPQTGSPHGCIDDVDEPATVDVRHPRMRSECRRQGRAQPLIQRVKPQGATQGIEGGIREFCLISTPPL